MAPHVNRQEVYAGKKMKESIYDERHYGYKATDKEMINTSPIDLFDSPDTEINSKRFPLYKYATRSSAFLSKGDCMFIPAFHFYQIKGFNLLQG